MTRGILGGGKRAQDASVKQGGLVSEKMLQAHDGQVKITSLN